MEDASRATRGAAVPLLSHNTALEAICPTAPYLLRSVVATLSTNPSLVLAIISMTLPNALVVWSQPGRLSVPRILADRRVRVTTVGSMLLLFGAAKHFRTKNAEGELAYKYKNIQSEYVGNLDMLKLYRKRLEAFDILSRATN